MGVRSSKGVWSGVGVCVFSRGVATVSDGEFIIPKRILVAAPANDSIIMGPDHFSALSLWPPSLLPLSARPRGWGY